MGVTEVLRVCWSVRGETWMSRVFVCVGQDAFSSWKNIATQAVRMSYSSDELALIIVMAQKEAVEVDLTLVSGQRL